jgi:hypothetical protein
MCHERTFPEKLRTRQLDAAHDIRFERILRLEST